MKEGEGGGEKEGGDQDSETTVGAPCGPEGAEPGSARAWLLGRGI